MSEQRLISLARDIDSRLERNDDSSELLAQSAAELPVEDFAELARAERMLARIARTRHNLNALNADAAQLFASESVRVDEDSTRQSPMQSHKKKSPDWPPISWTH